MGVNMFSMFEKGVGKEVIKALNLLWTYIAGIVIDLTLRQCRVFQSKMFSQRSRMLCKAMVSV